MRSDRVLHAYYQARNWGRNPLFAALVAARREGRSQEEMQRLVREMRAIPLEGKTLSRNG